MTIIELISSLSDNPYFGAGFGLFGVGAAAALMKRGLQGASVLFRRHYITTLEVTGQDKSYPWLLQWITTKGAKKTQHLSVETTYEQKETGKIKTKYNFIPSIGTHYFKYAGTWIRVERTREQQTMNLHMGIPWETVTLTMLGNNKQIFNYLLDEAETMALTQHEGKTILYQSYGNEWRPFGHPRNCRPIASVVLDKGISEKIVKDCEEFIAKPSWYIERGIPHRRGYLLYGPPGCGKSSFITALAGELKLGICLLSLSERTLSDDRLHHLLSVAPKDSIILLEDIDKAFPSRLHEEANKSQSNIAYEGLNRLTFSGFLNALDGVASTEATVVFMTTNFIERLDPALIRPGRVDVQEYIGYCSAQQIETMYLRFYKNENISQHVKDAKEFANSVLFKAKILEQNVSPADIQGYFMLHKHSDSIELLANIEEIWRRFKRYDFLKTAE